MSFLEHAKKRLNEVASMARRGSAPPELNPPSPGPPTTVHRRSRHERNTISLPYEAPIELSQFLDEKHSLKINPYKYPFLLKSDPMLDWEHAKTGQSNEFDAENQPGIEHKTLRNRANSTQAAATILNKFSDDLFDDYLFEIGILTELFPKFGDYIKEIEVLRECKSHRNIVCLRDAYYFDSKLWVN
jgi:hypothetical protein